MPVILTATKEFDLWLDGQAVEALKLQRPLPDEALRIVARGEKKDAPPLCQNPACFRVGGPPDQWPSARQAASLAFLHCSGFSGCSGLAGFFADAAGAGFFAGVAAGGGFGAAASGEGGA
jgi:hypothetical protein